MKRLHTLLASVLLGAAALTGLATAATPSAAGTPGGRAAIWKPPLKTRWQYQLTGNPAFDQTGGVNADICEVPYTGGACVRPQAFDFDLYADENIVGNNHTPNTAAVQAVHARGAKAICYVDAGGIEEKRPDYQEFVNWDNAHGHALIGKPYPGYPDERYANINNDQGQRDFMLSMMEKRLAKCVQTGFDSVEWDVVNTYEDGQATTGWNISYNTQLIYNRALADLAHRYGLSVGLKNDLSQIPDLVTSFDYAINEQCFQYNECDNLKLFVQAGKPVFQVEYEKSPGSFCPKANSATWNFNAIKKGADAELNDKPYKPCR